MLEQESFTCQCTHATTRNKSQDPYNEVGTRHEAPVLSSPPSIFVHSLKHVCKCNYSMSLYMYVPLELSEESSWVETQEQWW